MMLMVLMMVLEFADRTVIRLGNIEGREGGHGSAIRVERWGRML